MGWCLTTVSPAGKRPNYSRLEEKECIKISKNIDDNFYYNIMYYWIDPVDSGSLASCLITFHISVWLSVVMVAVMLISKNKPHAKATSKSNDLYKRANMYAINLPSHICGFWVHSNCVIIHNIIMCNCAW